MLDLEQDDELHIGGKVYPVCHLPATLFVAGTECLVDMIVCINLDRRNPLPVILGANFLQMVGGNLSFNKGDHTISCDPNGRDEDPPELGRMKPLKTPPQRFPLSPRRLSRRK